MLGFFRDPKAKKLEKVLVHTSRGNDEVQSEFLLRLNSASVELTKDFPSIETFADLKFALRPDQSDAMAEKAAEIQTALLKHPNADSVDELVFFLLEASLRHKAGHKWVGQKEAALIDRLVSSADRLETNK